MKTKLFFLVSLFICASLSAQEPVISFDINTKLGTPMTLKFRLKTAGNVQVDWGNGVKTTHAVTAHPTTTTIEGASLGSTLKVYNDELRYFECKEAGITSLDLSKALEMDVLFVDNNSLTSLNFSANTKLRQLGLSENPITSLELKEKEALTTIYLRNTQFDACALNALYDDLLENSGALKLFVEGNPGATTSKTSIATEKGWTIDIVGDGSGCPNSSNEAIKEEITSLVLNESVLYFSSGETGSIVLIDATGKTVLQADKINHLDISSLPKGLYLAKYSISGSTKTRKIIKE